MSDVKTVLISGATGLIGGRLLPVLARQGMALRALSRNPARAAKGLPRGVVPVGWDGARPSLEVLRGADAIVHLAGEPVFSGPLTAARRERIRASRVDSTRAFVDGCAALAQGERPRVLVCASAVGIYGSREDELLDEAAAPGEGFLADVCRAWEEAARGAEAHGLRVVSLRIGIVLAREGGALPLMATPFRLGLGGPLGNGRQWVPWVHVDDVAELARRVLCDDRARGPVNAVAPNPVRNAELTAALATQLRRPALLRVPAFALRLLLGELAGELLGSRRAVPARAEALGMRFAHERLETALATELGG